MSVPTCHADFSRLTTCLFRYVVAAAALASTSCAPVYLTPPAPSVYRCGEQVFWVAFGEDHASVTMPDGSLVTLDHLDAENDSNTPQTFTDGRLTFVQEAGETDEPRVLFARGRMTPTPCERRE